MLIPGTPLKANIFWGNAPIVMKPAMMEIWKLMSDVEVLVLLVVAVDEAPRL